MTLAGCLTRLTDGFVRQLRTKLFCLFLIKDNCSLDKGIAGIAGITGITGIIGITGITGIIGIIGIGQLYSGIWGGRMSMSAWNNAKILGY